MPHLVGMRAVAMRQSTPICAAIFMDASQLSDPLLDHPQP
jgi:hypothetical protein